MKTNFRTYMEHVIETSSFRSQKQVANAIGVPTSTFSNWLNGRHQPPYNAIIALSVLFYTKVELRSLCVYNMINALSIDEEQKEKK